MTTATQRPTRFERRARPFKPCYATATLDAPGASAETVSTAMPLPENVVDGGEIILLAIKPSIWRPIFDSVPWLIACGALSFALIWHGLAPFGIPQWATVQLILFVSIVRFALALFRWVPSWYVLTNRRIITIRGVRVPQVLSCSLLKLKDMKLTANFLERLAGLGTVGFVVEEGTTPACAWESIAYPEEVHSRIRRAIRDARHP